MLAASLLMLTLSLAPQEDGTDPAAGQAAPAVPTVEVRPLREIPKSNQKEIYAAIHRAGMLASYEAYSKFPTIALAELSPAQQEKFRADRKQFITETRRRNYAELMAKYEITENQFDQIDRQGFKEEWPTYPVENPFKVDQPSKPKANVFTGTVGRNKPTQTQAQTTAPKPAVAQSGAKPNVFSPGPRPAQESPAQVAETAIPRSVRTAPKPAPANADDTSSEKAARLPSTEFSINAGSPVGPEPVLDAYTTETEPGAKPNVFSPVPKPAENTPTASTTNKPADLAPKRVQTTAKPAESGPKPNVFSPSPRPASAEPAPKVADSKPKPAPASPKPATAGPVPARPGMRPTIFSINPGAAQTDETATVDDKANTENTRKTTESAPAPASVLRGTR